MTKYYRVRTPEQWDWLKNKLEIEDDSHVSNFPVTILYDDVICGIYRYHDDPEPLIEVSQLMEDEKMKYVTIKENDLGKINDQNGPLFGFDFNTDKYFIDGDLKKIKIPTWLLYPKVKMTQAEKDEFDKLKKRALTLIVCFRKINGFGYPHLDERLHGNNEIGQNNLAQNEFARAWADPSLIEVIPEKRWNVKVPPFSRTNQYYYKCGMELDWACSSYNDHEDQQFTESELKEYGLDDDMYEKVEVKE